MRVVRADAIEWMARCAPRSFELVLLDPPFDAGLADAALARALPLIADDGYVYVESGAADASPPPGLAAWRETRAGAVHARLWRRAG